VLGPGFGLKIEGVEGWGFLLGTRAGGGGVGWVWRGYLREKGGGCCGWFFSSRKDEGGGRMGKGVSAGFWNGELRGEGSREMEGGEGVVCEVALIGLLGRWG